MVYPLIKNEIEMKILDIECGVNKVEGSIGIDAVSMLGVDVVHNLSVIPWTF